MANVLTLPIHRCPSTSSKLPSCCSHFGFSPPVSPLQQRSLPGYVAERLGLYEELKRESDALLAKRAAASEPVTVELPDGRTVTGKAWVTTPYQLACDIRWVVQTRTHKLNNEACLRL